MKLSIFTTTTNPISRGDNINPSLDCYRELADEVVIVNGGGSIDLPVPWPTGRIDVIHHWPPEFDWSFIGEQFQRGYQACSGDWVIHADLDFIFHENDFARIRQALRDYPHAPAVSFYKWQFIMPDRYNLKSRLMLAVNKKAFGDRVTFSGAGDLCQPQLDGRDLDINDMPQAGVAFYNYEKLIKTEKQIRNDVARMDRAYHSHFGKWLYSEDGTEESAYEGWIHMAVGRASKPHRNLAFEDHPKYIKETIRNLKPEHWGYSGFGLLGKNSYVNS